VLIGLAHLLFWYRRRQGWDLDSEGKEVELATSAPTQPTVNAPV
jgi:hypothetical protein